MKRRRFLSKKTITNIPSPSPVALWLNLIGVFAQLCTYTAMGNFIGRPGHPRPTMHEAKALPNTHPIVVTIIEQFVNDAELGSWVTEGRSLLERWEIWLTQTYAREDDSDEDAAAVTESHGMDCQWACAYVPREGGRLFRDSGWYWTKGCALGELHSYSRMNLWLGPRAFLIRRYTPY